MNKIFLTILIAFNILSIKAQTYWQQQVNYNIAVQLNVNDNTIDAIEKIRYTNYSPDTLNFIWFHVWMNAYKNDKTAFCEQQLINGNTAFYFSSDKEKGYTNKLNFKVNNVTTNYVVDEKNIDIIKVLLPKPLLPNETIEIETPFHSQLPYNFSRGGHINSDYQLTQWYPKPAVYDAKGWHTMPYLDQGEFYSEFGNFEVSITVPKNYIVAATGELQNADELNWLKQQGKLKFEKQAAYNIEDDVVEKKVFLPAKPVKKKKVEVPQIATNLPTKTLLFKQNNIHDFAWFASKNFLVQYDTLQLTTHIVDCFSFIPKQKIEQCINNVNSIKQVLKKYSNAIGEYPYNTATVVVGKEPKSGGMEYPTITYITTANVKEAIAPIIFHEVGHNWFYGILGSNERLHAWMDEGMNTYYDERKENDKYFMYNTKTKQFEETKAPVNTAIDGLSVIQNSLIGIDKNMPIDTTSSAYPKEYYGLYVYELTAAWMRQLEKQLGKNVFDSAMKIYYNTWKFKHPYPQDFKNIVEQVSGKNITTLFNKLYSNEPLKPTVHKRFSIGFGLPNLSIEKMHAINIMPAATYNYYDGIRLGALIHNYNLPLPKFQFIVNPSYGTTSKAFNFFGRASYNIYKKNYWLQVGASYQNYTYNSFTDTNGTKYNTAISRFVPSIKCTFYNNDLRSTQRTIIGFKTFYLNQQNLLFGNTNITTPATSSYVNRLHITRFDNRVLYPYNLNFYVDQVEDLLRLNFTAQQFFNYGKNNDGVNVRFFAGKILYLKDNTLTTRYNNYNYWFNLIGTTGADDYTFSDYFIGRNEQQRGWKGQQIMERDGFFKQRMEYVSPVGKTDNWLMALNVNADFPKFPTLKFFADLGVYAKDKDDKSNDNRFLFDAGLQLSLFKNLVNIYAPILSSKVFRDYADLYLQENKFWKKISFTINLQKFQLNKISRDTPL